MGRVQAFELAGCRFWFYTGDHEPPHFHARVGDAGEIRVYFLREPPEHEVKWAVKHVSARVVREILQLAAEHRAALFEEWERNQADE